MDAQTAETDEPITTPAPVSPTTANQGDLTKVRELVLKAHPDVVPDLVTGASVDELIASVEPARGAYQRIAEQLGSRAVVESSSREERTSDFASGNGSPTSDPTVVQPPVVPAGGATNLTDPGDLAPTTKIQQALAARRKR